MNSVTIKHIKANDHYVTWHCGNCSYFRDLVKAGLFNLDENISLRSIEKKVVCDNPSCRHIDGTVNISHQESSNPYPGKHSYTTVPWRHGKLVDYEPDVESYRVMEKFIQERGKQHNQLATDI